MAERRICSGSFQYLRPYFYRHPYALRCQLGVGDSDAEYMANARRRAMELYRLLFPDGADAMMFNHWMYDGCAPEEEVSDWMLEAERETQRFLQEYQARYRHLTVRDLETYDDPEEEDRPKRNRVVCFSDGIGFEAEQLIEQEIQEIHSHEVSFVSFENECIFSVYDSRGCDIVFMTHEKMKAFYERLKPYFLAYDAEEMARRYRGEGENGLADCQTV